jgi:hypothetical protein
MLKEIMDPKTLFKHQMSQYQKRLILEDTVGAVDDGNEKLGKIQVTELGSFYCQFVTGHFTTLSLDDQTVVDDGIPHLRAVIKDGLKNTEIDSDFTPINLYLTPGRIKSMLSADYLNDPVSNNLFYPIPLEYLFGINSHISVNMKNDSTYLNKYAMLFHGWYLLPREGRNLV